MGLSQKLGLSHSLDNKEVEKLFFLELKSFLHKIYDKLGKKNGLKFSCPSPIDIGIKGNTAMGDFAWYFELGSESDIKKGRIGRIYLRADHASIIKLRKRAAAHIAAEWFLYHKYVNLGPDKFKKIKGQKVFSFLARHKRAKIVRHILAAIGELRYEHINVKHIVTARNKDRKITREILEDLNIAEKDFKKIEEQLGKKELVKLEELDLIIAAEENELGHLLALIKEDSKVNDEDEKVLRTILSHLREIRKSDKKWIHEKEEKAEQLKKKKINLQAFHNFLDREREQEKVNMGTLHVLFKQFEGEKARIIGEIRLAA